MARRGSDDQRWAAVASRLVRVLGRRAMTLDEAERLYREAEDIPLHPADIEDLALNVVGRLRADQLRATTAAPIDVLFSTAAVFLSPRDIIASEIVYEGTELVTDFDSISVDTRQSVAAPHFTRRWSVVPDASTITVDVWPVFDEHDGSSLRNVRLGTLCCDAYLDDCDFDWNH